MGRLQPAILALVLLAAPLAGALVPPAERVVAPLPHDLPDAELLLLLGRLDDPALVLPARLVVGEHERLDAVILRLAARGGSRLAEHEVAAFAALDPRLAAPTLAMLLAIERAWDLVDDATRSLPPGLLEELALLPPTDPRVGEGLLAAGLDKRALVEAALLVTDTAESVVIPALESAAALGIWPASPLADPAGVLRLGSPGPDVETLDRILQLDPGGDDEYYNNAGGSTLFDPLFGEFNILTPIAVSIDLAGDDVYDCAGRFTSSQGGADLGIGFGYLVELEGNDEYTCFKPSMGYGSAILHDHAGNDTYRAGSIALGFGSVSSAVHRDDAGDDWRRFGRDSGGYASFSSTVSLFWDRGGADNHSTDGAASNRIGWADNDARGWFVDEGPEEDYYQTATWPTLPARHGCNGCTWERGTSRAGLPPNGQGNDGAGGLAWLIAHQDTILRRV